MATVAERVAFKYKEKKQTKVDRISKQIREATGVSKSVAEDVADAIVRHRELDRLAMQKGWPVDEHGHLSGPKGTLDLSTVQV